IEHKHGIHGVPTAELQYNNVPAQLCGLRKRGLTKYVMSLMNGARVAIAGQALGIAEAAYRDARKYASEREQFKQSIDKFPAIFDMLARMKVKIVAARTLLYETTKVCDLKHGYTHRMEAMDPAAVPETLRENQKNSTKLAGILTPMAKAMCTEIANQVAYDGVQIHGGTGYMHDFNAERYARDARITNIYEGTTQLQIVAAIGGVVQRVLDPLMDKLADLPYEGSLERMNNKLDGMRSKLKQAVKFVNEKKDSAYQSLMARPLVEMETMVFVGLLMLRDALKEHGREPMALKYILDSEPEFESRFSQVMSNDYTTIDRHGEIIDY
ncbi:MAG: hypothetical protein JW808_09055, partial [Victivallales bacterium]|nr:hypothetical protein [Victivallales bacterium]